MIREMPNCRTPSDQAEPAAYLEREEPNARPKASPDRAEPNGPRKSDRLIGRKDKRGRNKLNRTQAEETYGIAIKRSREREREREAGN